jgi:hypothetical protein
MYGLPQAGILANNWLIKHLVLYGYTPTKSIPGLYHNANCPVTFLLVIDDLKVKFVGHKHASKHLVNTLQNLFKITTEWEGKLYCGIALNWDYINCLLNTSMLDYIKKAHHQFQVPTSSWTQHCPHASNRPNYGIATQLTP